MAVPIDDLLNTFLDQATDSPSQARVELNNLLLKVKALLAAIGTGANNALKLDSNGNIPTGVALANAVAIASGGTGATTAAQALINLGIIATAAKLNYTNVASLGNAQAGKCVTSNSGNFTHLTYFSFIPAILGGTGSAYTLSALGTYRELGRVYHVRPYSDSLANATLSINGNPAQNIITYPPLNNIQAGQMIAGMSYALEENGGTYVLTNPSI